MISEETGELIAVIVIAVAMLTAHHLAQASLVSSPPSPPADPLSWHCPDDRCYFPGLDYTEPKNDRRFP